MIYINKEFEVWANPETREIKIRQENNGVVIDVSQFGALVKAIGLCADEIFRAEKSDSPAAGDING